MEININENDQLVVNKTQASNLLGNMMQADSVMETYRNSPEVRLMNEVDASSTPVDSHYRLKDLLSEFINSSAEELTVPEEFNRYMTWLAQVIKIIKIFNKVDAALNGVANRTASLGVSILEITPDGIVDRTDEVIGSVPKPIIKDNEEVVTIQGRSYVVPKKKDPS